MRYLFLALLIMMAGCASLQDLSMSDLRQAKYMKRQGNIDKPLVEIQDCIEKHKANCGTIENLTYHDNTGKKASYILYGMGLTQRNPYVIIDLRENSPSKTQYTGYAIYSTWTKFIDEFVVNVNVCGQCPK